MKRNAGTPIVTKAIIKNSAEYEYEWKLKRSFILLAGTHLNLRPSIS